MASRKRRVIGALILALLVFAFLVWWNTTIFVVQPIGAVPAGRTLVISRLKGTRFIDSADAMCLRIQGSVNLICRAMVLGQVSNNATIYARLPYSETLYRVSTGGRQCDR